MTAGFSASGGRTAASGSVLLGIVPLVFVAIFVRFIALIVVVAVKAGRRERERREQLWAYAMQCGWRPVPVGAPLPGPVTDAARSRRAKLVLGTRFDGF